ncbi:bh protein [Priestia endophytica]|uniref:bh protein n=1 Tax=Priestia endophytica TaxID=135735 RepID=UPI000DCA66BF|nr:bh protein [Priestia endophytica]RAS86396.1 bh protein [Priestia endophytica]
MKSSKMEANLYCITCDEETPHLITYINHKIESVQCEDCKRGMKIRVDIMKEFYKEVYSRISTKPSRITKEYKEDLSGFLYKVPIRMISKPYRIMNDLNESRKVIRRFKRGER